MTRRTDTCDTSATLTKKALLDGYLATDIESFEKHFTKQSSCLYMLRRLNAGEMVHFNCFVLRYNAEIVEVHLRRNFPVQQENIQTGTYTCMHCICNEVLFILAKMISRENTPFVHVWVDPTTKLPKTGEVPGIHKEWANNYMDRNTMRIAKYSKIRRKQHRQQ